MKLAAISLAMVVTACMTTEGVDESALYEEAFDEKDDGKVSQSAQSGIGSFSLRFHSLQRDGRTAMEHT